MLDYYQNQLQNRPEMATNHEKHGKVEFNYRWLCAANNHLDKITINYHDLLDLDQAGRTRKTTPI
ncbi:DUF3187 family protein [Vibrio lentus]|nr:DUF3187 family protein [Vibrio lentus]